MPLIPLLERFAGLNDPRQTAKVLYPLPAIMLLSLAATIAEADDFVEATLWGAEHLAFLRQFYPYKKGIPSHDTLSHVFAALDPELFRACFLAWLIPTSWRSTARLRRPSQASCASKDHTLALKGGG